MRSYELVYIVHPEVDDVGLAAANETIKGLVERSGGQVLHVDPWGLRRLAFPIRDVREGQYVLMYLSLDPQRVAELERGLGLTEQVLRHLIVRPEEGIEIPTTDVESETAEADVVSAAGEEEAQAGEEEAQPDAEEAQTGAAESPTEEEAAEKAVDEASDESADE